MKKFLLIFMLIIGFSMSSLMSVANAVPNEYVYLGGMPLGVIVNSEGLIIQDTCGVITDKGEIFPSKEAGILPNDVLLTIDNQNVKSIQDINKLINSTKKDTHILVVKRDSKEIKFNVKAELDKLYKLRKLGLIIKNDIAGVGTLTYIRSDNLRFGGLGHQILSDTEPNKELYTQGSLFNCNIIGIIKGEKGKAGELKGSFSRNSDIIGKIDRMTFSGIFGFFNNKMIDGRPMIKIGNKEDVKSGKAYIYSTLNGSKPEKYEIEITKVNKQNSPEAKSINIEIKDERLLAESNGIVQGMSGSPIVQNDKLIGAVTHVLIGNPHKGFGIYIDWMINN